MLREDPNLPLLDMAWSRHKMVDFFNRNVLPSVSPGQKVTAVVRDRVAYEPGRQCAVLYSLGLGDAPEAPSRQAVVTFAKDDSLQKVYNRHYRKDAGSSWGGARDSAVYVPQYRCLVEFFPFDWKLPSLVRAMDPVEMASAPGWPGDGIERARSSGPPEVKTLHYVPHRRCVVRHSVQSPGGGNSGRGAVVKAYPQGPQARQIWRVLDTLHPQGAARGIIIPRTSRMVDGWNVIVMEDVPGTSLKKALKRAKTHSEARAIVRLAAGTLATLHDFHCESEQVRSFDSYLEFLRGEAAGVDLVAPPLARQALAVLHQVARLPLPAHGPPSFIHGDCAPSQFLTLEDRMAVVDFDNACLGDPAMDVGNFMAKLYRRAVSKGRDHHRQLSHDFLAAYREYVRDGALEERARVYQVLTLVRQAMHTFRRSPRSYVREGPASLPILLLQEAASCLGVIKGGSGQC